MKILLTGSNGMLGSSLVPLLKKREHEVLSTDIDLANGIDVVNLDVRNFSLVEDTVQNFKPEIVMHLAAETDVDLCEQNPDTAFETNTMGTQNVAIVCRKYNIPLLYVSSVGVFDGNKIIPYIESDVPAPLNIYGASKLEGERIVRNLVPNHFIVRAGWMFGGGPQKDKKFVGKIIKQIKEGARELTVVNDKIGTPTYTYAISDHVERIIKTDFWGTYHCSCKGICTRVDVAREILKNMGLLESVFIREVSSANYPLPARRPYSECMDNLMLRLRNMDQMPDWKDCIKEYVELF